MKIITMRVPLLFAVALFCHTTVLAQPPKKQPVKKEQAPSSKEMEDMIKQLQQQMDQMDPEAKKMLDSMGIKKPSLSDLPKMSNQQLATAMEDEGRLIPRKKTSLIASIPAKPLDNTAFFSFIKRINTAIAGGMMKSPKEMADKVLVQFQNDPHKGAMIASAANGMWTLGMKQQAVYLMGKACELLPNADNYNNFAAYLSMSGASHIAIPILDKLNSIHHKNSTIYNNLGHAWLELGDAAKAENYLDSALKFYLYHPQANYTKGLLAEAKGQKDKAVFHIRMSLVHSVTKTRLDKLYQLEGKDKAVKSLKLRNPKTYYSASFNPNKYLDRLPMVYSITAGIEVQKQWDEFYREMGEQETILTNLIRGAEMLMSKEAEKWTKIKMGQRPPFSPYYFAAVAGSAHYLSEQEIQSMRRNEADFSGKYTSAWATLKSTFERELRSALDSIERNAPANSPLLLDNCPVSLPLVNKHVKLINTLNKKYHENAVVTWFSNSYRLYNAQIATATSEASALYIVLTLELDIVRKLKGLKHESYDLSSCVKEAAVKINKKGPMPDYDDVHCKSSSTLYVPFTGQITIKCNEMTVQYNPLLVPLEMSFTTNFNGNQEVLTAASIGIEIEGVDINIAGTYDKEGKMESGEIKVGKEIGGVEVSITGEFDKEGFKKSSIEMGIDNELKLLPKSITDKAPIELGMKGEAAVGFELDKEGIVDFYVKEKTEIEFSGSVKADIQKDGEEGINLYNELAKVAGAGGTIKIPQPKLETGASVSAENRWSVNSGYSVERSTDFTWLK